MVYDHADRLVNTAGDGLPVVGDMLCYCVHVPASIWNSLEQLPRFMPLDRG